MKACTFLSSLLCVLILFGAPAFADSDPAYLDELQEQAEQRDLASERQWRTLVHYRSKLIGGSKSDIDSPSFFLADEGKTDPQAELEATLTAFFAPPREPVDEYDPIQEHPQCRFRARYVWLKRELDFDPRRLEEQECEDFREWRDTLGARSATLIFADSYMNNPASMFGHTLLRLDRSERGDPHNLTSYVVNYAAEPWTQNPFLYTVLGVSGGFDAYFSTLPYYLKTQEYSDMESRDLWEYELRLSDEQLARMVRHLWELQPHPVDYYYFDENCSFHLLSLLEAADPSLRLTERFPLHVIPADTVREVLEEEGLSGEKVRRPSKREVMLAQRERLDEVEKKLAYRLGAEQEEAALDELDELVEDRQAAVLEAGHALWSYLHREDDERDRGWEHKLLVRRGKLDVDTPRVDFEASTAPEEGHGTARATLSGGFSRSQSGFLELGIRPALHDLAASDVGYAPLSQIEFLNARLRAFGLDETLEAPQILLQRLDVIDIVSLAPFDAWDPKWSWGVKTGFLRTYRDGCGDKGCLMYDLEVGFGGTVELGPLATYLLFDGQVAAGASFNNFVRLASGPRLGALLRMGDAARLHLEGRYRYPFWGEGFPEAIPTAGRAQPPWSTQATLSLKLGQNVETRLNGVVERGRTEANAGIHWYF